MKKKYNNTKSLLYQSFDTELNEQQQQILNDALQNDSHLKEEKMFISNMRDQLSSLEKDFSPHFESRLMQKLNEEILTQNIFTIKTGTFKAIALSGVAAILVVLLSVYFIDGSISLESLMGINGYNPDMGMLTFF